MAINNPHCSVHSTPVSLTPTQILHPLLEVGRWDLWLHLVWGKQRTNFFDLTNSTPPANVLHLLLIATASPEKPATWLLRNAGFLERMENTRRNYMCLLLWQSCGYSKSSSVGWQMSRATLAHSVHTTVTLPFLECACLRLLRTFM